MQITQEQLSVHVGHAGGRATQEAKAEARKGAHTRCMQPFSQRSRAGWIGVPKWVVIVERALTRIIHEFAPTLLVY